ncbi:uncharacterized protein LOC124266520 [Haliotis rubra]|uniref:uncharacterized protein LOC124266520 n=1 Tax=Haliotis rubra TaxID=36100 RepID=UPI001EE53F08|nr:uncharacterized protein LOC124266520 [Haliotis rubra]
MIGLSSRRCSHGYRGGFASYGATGNGGYGASLGKQNAIYFEPVRDILLKSIKTIPIQEGHVFNIGDYGTADGATSMTFMTDLLKVLQDHHGPGMEFRWLLLSGCPRHQLSYKDSLCIYPESSDEEKEAMMKAGGEAWETFLVMRSKELIPGGILFVAVCCEYTDVSTGEQTYTSKSFLLLASRVWKAFRDSGKISDEEFINTNFPIYLQTREQLTSPFNDIISPVRRSGLQLLFSEVYINADVFYDDWMQKKDKEGIDDREEFARMYVAAHRNWGNSTFINGLSDSRLQEEKEKIVDELFATIEKHMTFISPDEFKNNMGLTYLIIRKRA